MSITKQQIAVKRVLAILKMVVVTEQTANQLWKKLYTQL